MRGKVFLATAIVAVALLAGPAVLAQSTTIEVKEGEVLAVDGNMLTYRGPEGVKQVRVPDSLRFNMNGKSMSVHELKPGMKLTALIKTTETPVELTETKIREGEVVHTSGPGGIVVVRNAEGQLKKFSGKELRESGVIIYRNGKRVPMDQLRKGDRYSATIITKLPPVTITDRELEVMVAQAPPPPPKRVAKPKPVAKKYEPAKLPKTGSPLSHLGLAGLVLLALGGGVTLVRRLF